MTMDDPYAQGSQVWNPNRTNDATRQSPTGSSRGLMGDAAPLGHTQSPPKPGAGSQDRMIQNIQTEINAATGQMETNILKITERGETLDHLKTKTDNLSFSSQKFKSTASSTRRRMWFQNAKWTICLSIFIILIFTGIIVGAIKGSAVVKERVVEHMSSLSATSTPTGTSASPSILGAAASPWTSKSGAGGALAASASGSGAEGGTINLTPGASPTSASG